MAISTSDIIPLGQMRARLTELAEAAHAGGEKIITRNGESYVALIGADKLDYYHALERENLHLIALENVVRGLDDVAAGHVIPLEALRGKFGR